MAKRFASVLLLRPKTTNPKAPNTQNSLGYFLHMSVSITG
ncbi:hypothetical protein HMPREF9439_02568 [Parasutterella excrementihominis YIT 11859]|uniref:Uncharacterized protein n=1 Tax=Parasutterella excrementihominis YIT 11859 TaxID=762966 RepID=F3QNN2_9BURK|nr:hypothetical protein HMPREF9439_02568 [Parasutterella excrementihominis YIT 11859]